MNFEEAVKAMKEGKQIKRKGGFQLLNIHNNFCLEEIEATDWEIVDEDKDWNLAEQREPKYSATVFNARFTEDIKKCRDLIIKDIEEANYTLEMCTSDAIIELIKERFGDL